MPHGESLSPQASGLRELQLSPQLQHLTQAIAHSQDLAARRGTRLLAGSVPACAGNPDCHPDPGLLPTAIDQGLQAARERPGLYRMVLNFLAAQLVTTDDPAQQGQIRDRIRQIAHEALAAISDPNFSPPPDNPAEPMEPIRTKTRMLFDLTCTLSALLNEAGQSGFSAEDRSLLRTFFIQIQAGMEQTRLRHQTNPHTTPFPEYFEHFIQAQIAFLDGNSLSAFQHLFQTRAILSDMPADRRGRALPQLVETSTELALQSFPNDLAGEQAADFRTLLSLDAFGYFYQADYVHAHGEGAIATAQRQGQALSIAAGVYLSSGHFAADANSVLTAILNSRDQGANRTAMLEALEQRYQGDRNFQQSVARLYPGNWGDAAQRRQSFGRLLDEAVTVAQHLRDHQSDEPFRTVFSRDREARPLNQAAQALAHNASLTDSLRLMLHLGAEATPETIVLQLSEFGERLPVFLDSLPANVRGNPENERFFSQIRGAALGYRGTGLRANIEEPTQELLDSLAALSREDEHFAPAYFAFFRGLQSLEQVAPETPLSSELRRRARRAADAMEEFNGSRVLRHLSSPSSIGMLLGGIVLSELAPLWLLRGARIPFLRGAEAAAAVRGSGELGYLIRGGQLTLRGEMLVGVGVGLAMQGGSLAGHLYTTRGLRVGEYGQELQRIGVGSLAWGTVFSMLAMAGTVGAGSWLRGRMLPEGAALSPGRLALGGIGLRLGNWTIGGGLMLGAHSATAALSGHSAMPTGEQAAEVFLSMALWDAAAGGLRLGLGRTRWWQHQLGPFRAHRLVRSHLDQVLERAPELANERAFLESYLRTQLRSPRRFQEITRALAEGRTPRLEGSGSRRRLVFEIPTRETATDTQQRRIEAARTIVELSEAQVAHAQRLLNSASFENHPEGIGLIRRRIRELLARGAQPELWVRARIEGDLVLFEALPSRPRRSQRDGTFRMTDQGITHLQTQDPLLRYVIRTYNSQIFAHYPVLPPSVGTETAPRIGSEDATAAHRPARALSSGGDSEASGETGESPSDGTADGVPDDAEPRPSTALPTPNAERPDGLPPSPTSPHQPSQELLDAARRTLPGVDSSRRRRDETVPFTTEQSRRARRQSRPDTPLPSDDSTTRRLGAREREELQRTLEEFQPEDSSTATSTREDPSQVRSRPLSEPPMDVSDQELSAVENNSEELDPLAEPETEEAVTIRPTPLPNPVLAGPPPLPRRPGTSTSETGYLEASPEAREDELPVPLLTIRRRAEEAMVPRGTDPSATLRMDPSSLLVRLSRSINSFIGRLENLSRQTRDDIIFIEISLSDSGIFRFTDAMEYSQNRNPNHGYFRIRVTRPGERGNTSEENQYSLIGDPILPPELGSLRTFIRRLFDPNPQPLEHE